MDVVICIRGLRVLHAFSCLFLSSYQLEGVTIVSKQLKELSELSGYLTSGSTFDAVIDNNSKDVEQAAAISDAVKVTLY